MKNSIIISVVLSVTMLLTPLFSLGKDGVADNFSEAVNAPLTEDFSLEPKSETTDYNSFRILNTKTNKIEVMSAKDYIRGVVLAEVPARYEVEALKAQTVAAYSFACYKKERATGKYDLSTDPSYFQSFVTDEEAKKNFGEKSDEYFNKVSDAVNSVIGQRVTYNGKTALCCYFAISSGKTENCLDVWGGNLPYLVSVDSIGDKLADSYITNTEFTKDEICKNLSVSFKGTGNMFKNIKRTDAGRVKTVTCAEKEFTGAQVAKSLGLRSANFDVAYDNGKYCFCVKGYGHGVGMSQNGANYMAKQGSKYDEILLHYYTGCAVSE